MSQGCALLILGSKGQRSRSQCIDHWKWFMLHNCFPFTPIIMKLHIKTFHELRMCPLDFGVNRSKVKVTMYWFLKMVSFLSYLTPWNFTQRLPLSWGCALLILESKGQRSRWQCLDYWKWFKLHNCISLTPIIIKLHIKTPFELRMCSVDFGVKSSKVKVTMHWFLKMSFAHNCFIFTPIIMKLHT